MEQSKLKDRSKQHERLKTEITKMKVNMKCCILTIAVGEIKNACIRNIKLSIIDVKQDFFSKK